MEVWDLATWRDFIKRRYPRFYETEAQLREKAGRGDAMKIEDARKLIKEARDWYTACDDRCMPGCCCGCDVTALADLAEKALAELAYIDSILARRPALDLPTRAENIEKAINAAKQADVALADVERLEKVCEVLTGEVNGNALLAEKALAEVERLKGWVEVGSGYKKRFEEEERYRQEAEAEVERLKGLLAALHPASGTTINLDELLTGWKKQAEADLAALRSVLAEMNGARADAEIEWAQQRDALSQENRVLKERAARFRDMAEMVERAFRRDDFAAMQLFGTNVPAHIAREVLLAAEPKPESD